MRNNTLKSSEYFMKREKSKFRSIALLFSVILASWSTLYSQEKESPILNTDPAIIGEKVAINIINRSFGWRYQKVAAYYGALIFADASGNAKIANKIEEGFAPYNSGKKKYKKGHVDYNVFGLWPLELYRQTGNEEYLKKGIALADDEYKNPQADGLTDLTRYWVDDMYMVGSLQIQAYKNTGDKVYLDRAALHLYMYIDSLQMPNGLFFHRPDAPHYWGRGNGWAAAAMAEVLPELPKDHEYYDVLLSAYRKMMRGLLNTQGDSGMWHQLLNNHDSFEEPSCSGMFLFAMITGLDHGLLPHDKYIGAIENGWNALCDFVNDQGEVVGVCMWTNAKERTSYYLRRPRITGDYHGQAAVLWAATAMIKLMDEEE